MIGEMVVDYGMGVLGRYKTDRQNLDAILDETYAAYRRDDRFRGKWKAGEGQADATGETVGRSTLHTDYVRQKVLDLVGIQADAVMSAGRLAFMLVDDSLAGEQRVLRRMANLDPAVEARLSAIRERERYAVRLLEQGKSNEQFMRALHACGLWGVAYLKYLVKDIEMEEWVSAGGAMVWQASQRQVPAFEYVSPYNMFYDLAAGWENSALTFEVQRVSLEEVAKLRGRRGVINENLDLVLAERADAEPAEPNERPAERDAQTLHQPRKIIEAWGLMPRAKVEAALQAAEDSGQPAKLPGTEEKTASDKPEMTDMVRVRAQFCGKRLISIREVPRRERVYGQLICEEVLDGIGWEGVGTAVLPWQNLGTGAMRALDDNVKQISNVIYATHGRYLKPGSQFKKTDIGLELALQPECDDINKAIMQFEVSDVTGPLRQLQETVLNNADYSSKVNRIKPGIGPEGEQTKAEYMSRAAKADKYAGQTIRNLDSVVEWMLEKVDGFIMRDPKSPVEKIPLRVRALGFSAFRDKTEILPALYSIWDRVKDDEELRSQVKPRAFLDKALELAGLDEEEFTKTPAQLMEEAEAQQAAVDAANAGGAGNDPAQAMQLALMQANVEKLRRQSAELAAREQLTMAKANATQRKALIDTADAVQRVKQPAGAAPSGQTSAVSGQAAPVAASFSNLWKFIA